MTSKQFIYLFFLLVSVNANCQVKGARGTYIFPAFNGVSIPDSLSEEEAFFVENVTTYDFMEDFTSEIVVFKRIYINSEAAAEEYSQRDLLISNDGFMSMLAARTLKKNGDVLTLKGDQIIETVSEKKNKYGNETVRRIQFVYPDVEVGDVIDLAYELDLSQYIYSDLLYLEDEIPSLHSRINLRNLSLLDLSVFRLNDSPEIVTRTVAGVSVVSWEKYGVSTMKSDYYNALAPDFPSLIFILWKRGESLDYKTVYEFDEHKYPENYSPLVSVTKILINQGVIEAEDDEFTQLKKLISYFENECEWTFDIGTSNVRNTIEFLNESKVDKTLFFRYIMKFLREKWIRYEKGYSKSLLKGHFEHGIVSLEQLSERFLVIYDRKDQPHFLFPPRGKNQFYYLDEIPYYVEGNQSIALYGEKGFLKEKASILIPESGFKDNAQMSQIKIAVQKDSLKTHFSRTDKFSGHYSFLTRGKTASIWLDELNVAPDSVEIVPASKLDYYPYTVTYKQEDLTDEFFVDIGDSLVWFSPEKLFPKGLYQADEMDAVMGEYLVLPFLKRHAISIFLKSDGPLTIAEEESALSYKNDAGSIEILLYQMTENVVKVQLTVAIEKRKLRGDDIEKFTDLVQNYSEMISKKWVLKN